MGSLNSEGFPRFPHDTQVTCRCLCGLVFCLLSLGPLIDAALRLVVDHPLTSPERWLVKMVRKNHVGYSSLVA